MNCVVFTPQSPFMKWLLLFMCRHIMMHYQYFSRTLMAFINSQCWGWGVVSLIKKGISPSRYLSICHDLCIHGAVQKNIHQKLGLEPWWIWTFQIHQIAKHFQHGKGEEKHRNKSGRRGFPSWNLCFCKGVEFFLCFHIFTCLGRPSRKKVTKLRTFPYLP